jgi:hypothetical protein
MLANEV